MARRSLRLTSFTRFLLIMVMVAPLAYMGAAYYNGEDGWSKLKQLVGVDLAEDAQPKDSTTKDLSTEESGNQSATPALEIAKLKQLVADQEAKINSLGAENQKLRERIEELEKKLNPSVQ